MAMGELVMRCFHARTTTHVQHLRTRSYAVHKATQDFYEEIVDLVDKLAETYQGEYGLIDKYPAKYSLDENPLDTLTQLYKWIEEYRFECCDEDDTCVQNIIDEICALVQSTIYKLKFLK